MGCNTSNAEWSSGGKKCTEYDPPSGVWKPNVVTYPVRNTNLNWPEVDRDRVMYSSFIKTGNQPTRESCGKEFKTLQTIYTKGGGSQSTYQIFQHVPSELSLYPIYGDMWFMIEYDTYDYFRGTPCKRFETVNRRDSWPDVYESSPGPPDPETGEGTTQTTQTQFAGSSDSNEYICIPCSGSQGQCRPSKSTITYQTPDGNLSGDTKNPYPTIWAVDTDSPYIVFSYDDLSTTVPDGMSTLSISHNTQSQVLWTDGGSNGVMQSSIGNWDQDDGGTELIVEFDDEIRTGSVQTGDAARLTMRITPIITDLTNDVYTYGGSEIEIVELSNPGTGYSAGQTFTFSHTYTHENNATTTWNFTLTVDAVEDFQAPTGSTLALLSTGDVINGHTVVRALHTDVVNFQYHVLELSGTGSNFTKDTGYTSGRNHDITVRAGYGVADRATLIGLYEFRNKNIQYVTKQLRPDVPHYYDDIVAPVIEAQVSNGKITGATVISGGSGLNNLDKKELEVSTPQVKRGKRAKVKGNFSGGSLQSVDIIDSGSGYSTETFEGNDGVTYKIPTIAIADFDKHEEKTLYESNISPDNATDSYYDEVENDAIFNASGDKIGDGIGKQIYQVDDRKEKAGKATGFADVIAEDTDNTVIDVYEVKYFRPKEFFVGEPDDSFQITVEGKTREIGKGKKMKSPTRNTEYKYFQNGKDAKDFVEQMKTKNYKAKLTKYEGVYRRDYFQVLSDRLEHEKTGRGFGKTMTDGTEVPLSKKDRKKIRTDRYQNIQSEERKSVEIGPKYTKIRRADKLDRIKLNRETTDQFPRPLDDTKDIFKEITNDNQSSQFKESFSAAQKRADNPDDVKTSAQKYQDQLDGLESFYIEELTHDQNRDEDNFFRPEDVEVRTVETSFQRLPCASRFQKYQIRQYVPDNREKTEMTLSLRVEVPQIDPDCTTYCSGLGGNVAAGDVGQLVDFESVTITRTYNNIDVYGGCEGFTANGKIDIYNDFSASAALFQQACEKMGNPFDSICSNQ